METLIQRLVQNPHDEDALARAHNAGARDPRSYALLLEKVGQTTGDPAYAAHWLSEAANVWSMTIGDAHHAARTLMIAIDKDPTATVASERLAQLYREKGDQKALVALLERMVKSLGPLMGQRSELRPPVIAMHEELGRLWNEPPLSRPERAIENWRRVAELDPQNVFAIYQVRELYKAAEQWSETLPYFVAEQALVDDVERKLALYRDEAAVRSRLNDGVGASQSLRNARIVAPEDMALVQELGTSILVRVEAGERVSDQEREEARALFLSLAETYDGEYGFTYAISALKCAPGDDRALQLADHYGKLIGRQNELKPQFSAYLAANPAGFMAVEARSQVGSRPPPPPAGSKSMPPSAPAAASKPEGRGSRGSIPAVAPAPADSDPGFGDSEPEPDEKYVNPAEVRTLLDQAQAEAQKGRKPTALQKFREALKLDPSNSEALSWVEEHLRQKRMYSDLRDVLLAASRVTSQPAETRKAQLRDVAGLCESQLRDLDTAISACKQICQLDRGDEQAREQLRRLLERGSRWDELSSVLEQEAMGAPDVETKIALEKKLAQLHEVKRKDAGAAAEAWARIAALSPADEQAIQTAVKLFEKAEQYDMAAQVIADNVSSVEDVVTRGNLLSRLGDLRLKAGDAGAAGDAFAEAAESFGPDGGSQTSKLWEQAEKAYATAERYTEAANAVDQRAQLADGKAKAALSAQAAELFEKADDTTSAIEKLEQAAEIDPLVEAYAEKLEALYRGAERLGDLAAFFAGRAEKLPQKAARIGARFKAAEVQKSLGDSDGARETWLLILNDGDDPKALAELVTDAEERGDHQERADLLHRLVDVTPEPEKKLELALQEAALFAEELDDPQAAVERYDSISKVLDPENRTALHAMAEMFEKLGDEAGAAAALERELVGAPTEEKIEIAQRLAVLYEGPLDDVKRAIAALDVVHAADEEDFDAVARLLKLTERDEDWSRVAQLLAKLIEVEGDEAEASEMTQRLATVQHEKLEKGAEALATLETLADQGDKPCQEAYVALGDELGWQGIVATKLVMWNEGGAGAKRAEALRGAFDRFLAIGRETDAARVALELARTRSADADLAEKLEGIAIKTKDLEALGTAHEILVKEFSGADRASELVRQAETMVEAGADPLEAMQHGEASLTSVPPADVEPLLERLAALTNAPGHVIDLYERQVGRCKQPAERLKALARAAQVASSKGAVDRAKSFFELALGGSVQEDTLSALEDAARTGDEESDSKTLRTILAEALAGGGQGSRDGGRTRAALLRRASSIAEVDLGDVDKAFAWLGDALVTYVDDAGLAALDDLGARVGDKPRIEATLGRALEEVFDGPLVRKLLARRARLRRDELANPEGAAADLKKLHDLSPSDLEVMNELSALLETLGDHRGMIHLYEDQILRGRDPNQRAELARKVARLWEEEVGDPRETADAWRRVLRMKAADPEATTGLERAKANNLKKPPPVYEKGSSNYPSATPSTPKSVTPGPAGSPKHDVTVTEAHTDAFGPTGDSSMTDAESSLGGALQGLAEGDGPPDHPEEITADALPDGLASPKSTRRPPAMTDSVAPLSASEEATHMLGGSPPELPPESSEGNAHASHGYADHDPSGTGPVSPGAWNADASAQPGWEQGAPAQHAEPWSGDPHQHGQPADPRGWSADVAGQGWNDQQAQGAAWDPNPQAGWDPNQQQQQGWQGDPQQAYPQPSFQQGHPQTGWSDPNAQHGQLDPQHAQAWPGSPNQAHAAQPHAAPSHEGYPQQQGQGQGQWTPSAQQHQNWATPLPIPGQQFPGQAPLPGQAAAPAPLPPLYEDDEDAEDVDDAELFENDDPRPKQR